MIEAFKNKTVLVTGHTGFKGSWLSIWLKTLGANVVGISDIVPTKPSNFDASNIGKFIKDYRINISDEQEVRKIINEVQPNFVFHLAAQALVKESYKNPLQTMKTNAMGSANILEALRLLNKKVFVVMITSDKAYDNVEWVWGYRENDKLGGKDPYSASKGMAELAIHSFVKSYFIKEDSNVKLAIARAGNVIGGGDWASDRIVPDCVRSWSQNKRVDIRSPNATRPWQHVLEPLSGYLLLATKLASGSSHGEAYNFGPRAEHNYSVQALINEMAKHWDNVQWLDTSDKKQLFHEAGLLKLNCDKALAELSWQAVLNFETTVAMTINWYKEFYQNNGNMFGFTVKQINLYCDIAESKNQLWAK